MLNQRIKTCRRRIILILAILLAVAILLIQCRASTDNTLADPIKSVSTDQKICSVTLSLTGIESEEAIRLFMSVCRGTGITPCVFVSVDWLEDHGDALLLLDGAELGLLFPKSPQKWTQKRTMAAIAEANEAFMIHTGEFPKFVRIADGLATQSVSVSMNSYGQLLVGSSSVLSETPAPGTIADCGLLDSTTGYTLAQYYGSALSQGYSILPISQLLNT